MEINMIEVTNVVKIYEWQDSPTAPIEGPELKIQSHWNDHDRVNIVTPDGNKYTVLARDLKCAITNATNSARF